jgi:hypothetical protein
LFLDDSADQLGAEDLVASELTFQQVCHELIVTVSVDDEAGIAGGGLDGGVVSFGVVFGEATECHPICDPAADSCWWNGSEV